MKLGLISDVHGGREKGSLLNSAFFDLKPPASSVYVHVLEAHRNSPRKPGTIPRHSALASIPLRWEKVD